MNAIAQLDSIFSYIASHLAANSSVGDSHFSPVDSGSPHRGLHRRSALFFNYRAPLLPRIAASHPRSISDGTHQKGRILHSSGGSVLRCLHDEDGAATAPARRRADSQAVGVSVLPGAGSGVTRDSVDEALGGRHISDGSNRCVA